MSVTTDSASEPVENPGGCGIVPLSRSLVEASTGDMVQVSPLNESSTWVRRYSGAGSLVRYSRTRRFPVEVSVPRRLVSGSTVLTVRPPDRNWLIRENTEPLLTPGRSAGTSRASTMQTAAVPVTPRPHSPAAAAVHAPASQETVRTSESPANSSRNPTAAQVNAAPSTPSWWTVKGTAIRDNRAAAATPGTRRVTAIQWAEMVRTPSSNVTSRTIPSVAGTGMTWV